MKREIFFWKNTIVPQNFIHSSSSCLNCLVSQNPKQKPHISALSCESLIENKTAKEMLRSLARAAATHHSWNLKLAPFSSVSHTSRPPKPTTPLKPDPKKSTAAAAAAALYDEQERIRQLAADDKNPSLDVGRNGRPLFTSSPSLSHLSRNDVCTYFKLTYYFSPTSFFIVAFCRTLFVRLRVSLFFFFFFFFILFFFFFFFFLVGYAERCFARWIVWGDGRGV